MNIPSMDKAPGVIGPYFQGYEVNGAVYTSGQIPMNLADRIVTEGIVVQAEQSCESAGAILETADTGSDRVFRITCLLTDMNDFGMLNEVYVEYFVSKSARSYVAIKTLPKGVFCEIEAIAIK